MCRPADAGKQKWWSRMLADNAATLHTWLHQGCGLIDVYECGDHWHIGHRRTAAGPGRFTCPPADRPARQVPHESS